MTRAQYDAEVADLLRAFAKVYDPRGPACRPTALESAPSMAISRFVAGNWSDSWYPEDKRDKPK